MRSPLLILALAVALPSCGKSDFEKAKDRYEFLQSNGGTPDQLCVASRSVADAAVSQGSKNDFALWNMTALDDCRSASLAETRPS